MTVTDTIAEPETAEQDTKTVLTTSDLANPRNISTTAVRQAARRVPPGAPIPDSMLSGRGIPWTWDGERPAVQAYLVGPEPLAEYAARIRDEEGVTHDVPPVKVREGMVVIGDVDTTDGVTLASAGARLTAEQAEQIRGSADVLPETVTVREGNISAGARRVGVDRQTFVRILEGQKWSQFGTQVKVLRAVGVDVDVSG